MEGAGFIRAHSEKVELKTNIFAEDNAAADGEEGQEAAEGEEAEAEEDYIYQDENGNRIDLAELGDFEDLAQLAELENVEGIDSNLAAHLKMLKQAQKKQQAAEGQNAPGHARGKTMAAPPVRNELDIKEKLGIDMDDDDDMDYDSDAKGSGSPVPDFNKL